MPRLLFVEQFYYPDGWGGAELPRTLTCYLAQKGYEVEVICGSDQYVGIGDTSSPNPQDYGVTISRTPRLFRGRIHQRKLLKQLWFYLCLVPLAVFRKRPDLYITQTNPPLVVVLIRAVAWVMRRPMVIIAQDIYPEMLVLHGMLAESSAAIGPLRRLFAWAYRGAEAVVALGPVMAKRVCEKGVDGSKIHEISNWATGGAGIDRSSANPLRREWGLENKQVLLYSGNIGVGHEFETLISGFRKAVAIRTSLELVFVGRGSRLDELRNLVEQSSVQQHVSFHDFVPSSELPRSMGIADIAIVTLRAGFEGLIAPSKALGYMARALPILYVGPHSDISSLVEAAGCGRVTDNGDADSVAEYLLELSADADSARKIGEIGKQFYQRELSEPLAMKKYDNMISDIVRAPNAR